MSFNVTDYERQWIAFERDFEYDAPTPKLRKATRAEVAEYYRAATYMGVAEDTACEYSYHRVIGVPCSGCNSPDEVIP